MIICLAAIFISFVLLSMVFNDFFHQLSILGFMINLNSSVVLFCLSFFIIDLVTEIYDDKAANQFILGKIVAQVTFIIFGHIGIVGTNIYGSLLAKAITQSPQMLFYSIIATYCSYRITTTIMTRLKMRFAGRYLMFRYFVSTFPGKVCFSLVFSLLSFSQGRSWGEYFSIFYSLILVKLVLSFIFSIIMVPVTRIVEYLQGKNIKPELILQ